MTILVGYGVYAALTHATQKKPAAAPELTTPATTTLDSAQPIAPTRAQSGFSTAIERVGPKAFLIGGSVEPPEGKAVDVIAALQSRAMQGEGYAALVIGLKLMYCRATLEHQDDDDALRVEAQAMGGLDAALRLRAQRAADCEGLAPEDYLRIGEWLQRAADGGDVVAQLTYAAASDVVLVSPSMMLKEPERIVEFRQRAMRYLHIAASNGSVDALNSLGQSYRVGILTPQDDVRAYAYFLAGQKADGRIKPWDMEQLEMSISPQQRQDAAVLAKEIYRDCCESPQENLDRRHHSVRNGATRDASTSCHPTWPARMPSLPTGKSPGRPDNQLFPAPGRRANR